MQKTIIAIGLFLVILGVAWPLVVKLQLGRLPGDIIINKPGLKLYIPITTMVVISLTLSLIAWLFRK